MANYQHFETVNGIYTLSDNKIYNVKEGSAPVIEFTIQLFKNSAETTRVNKTSF